MLTLTRLGDVQLSALGIYIFDPIHAENGDGFPGYLDGTTLHVEDADEASRLLTDAANSADPEGREGDPECDRLDRAFRDALSGLSLRILRAARK